MRSFVKIALNRSKEVMFMRYIPGKEEIIAIRYGEDPIPDWLRKYAEPCGALLRVSQPPDNPDLMGIHYVNVGDFLRLMPNGAIFHYKSFEHFMSLIYSKRPEDAIDTQNGYTLPAKAESVLL